MAAAILAQEHPPPQVACQFADLFWQGHRLVEIREEVLERLPPGHATLPLV
jgi:hypothetical protein